jgi:tubulin polyglutamylase TTLL6/13
VPPIFRFLPRSPHPPAGHDYGKIWSDIGDLIIKSLISVQPILRNNYRSVLPPDNDGFR